MLYQSLSRNSVKLRTGLAWLFVFAVVAALLGNTRYFVHRTAVVMADTTSLRVVSDANQHWLIEGGAALCLPNTDRRAALRRNDPICNQFLPSGKYKRIAINTGDIVEIRLEPDGNLMVRFPPCDGSGDQDCNAPAPIPNEISPRQASNGFVLIEPEAMHAAGPLAISGRISLGRELSVGGRSDFLLGGAYEIREQNWLTRVFGRRSVMLERGELIPGAAVEILSGSLPSASSNGHFYLSSYGGRSALKTIALSGTDNGSIRMIIEGAEPFTIDPDWMDSVIANPVFFAFAFLLGLLMNAIRLASSLAISAKTLGTHARNSDSRASKD